MASDPLTGLSARAVEERVAEGRVNAVPAAPSRTFGQIVRANVFTPVNGIIGALLVVILVAKPGADALFAGVVVSNTSLGILQELRAKRTLDALAVLSAPRARVVRDSVLSEVVVGEVVADDVLELRPGDQIVIDGEVLTSSGLEVDESLLTGESDPVAKTPGDEVLSGSFVAAGAGRVVATRIGASAYAASLAEEARRFSLVNSELRTGINRILRWLTRIIPPVALLVLIRLLDAEDDWREALRGMVAASVSMVPDGLVLLTSLSMIVGVLALARRKALAKELASVELLARVDVLCLDKTGTITTGHISFDALEVLGEIDERLPAAALSSMAAADATPNSTMIAIASAFEPADGWRPVAAVPFSSARKWSSVTFADQGSWFLGAPEMLLRGADGLVRDRALEVARAGRRVVLLCRSDDPPEGEILPEEREPAALVLLEDEVRPDAPEILEFLADQGLRLKVISGDHPDTVVAVARRAGVPDAHTGLDARTLPQDRGELCAVLREHNVFGRVTPHQKRAMVAALQSEGHVVAMTGDGVNDVLALKDADMGIAMGSGSSSTRAVAQLVLLDNSFATLPQVLAEGRRVINNIERVANLFVVKTTYAVLLAAAVGIAGIPFPFLPRHLTLVGPFGIGVPGFFLALSRTNRRARPGFVRRVVAYSLPAGTVAATATFIAYQLERNRTGISLEEARTAATIVLLSLGLVVLTQLAAPLSPTKVALVVTMALSYLVVLNVEWLADYFVMHPPETSEWWLLATIVAAGAAVLVALPRLPGPSRVVREDLPPRPGPQPAGPGPILDTPPAPSGRPLTPR